MSDLTVETHKAPPGWDHGTRASHRDGRLLPNGPHRRWGIRPRLMIGMLLAGLSLGWLGGLNSQWLLDAIFTSRDAHSAPHSAKIGGAVASLSALENADAASVMASADATGRTNREKLIKVNPFLEGFTVADLKNWAHRKMAIPGS